MFFLSYGGFFWGNEKSFIFFIDNFILFKISIHISNFLPFFEEKFDIWVEVKTSWSIFTSGSFISWESIINLPVPVCSGLVGWPNAWTGGLIRHDATCRQLVSYKLH